MAFFLQKIGGLERTFTLLSVDDLRTIQGSMPNPGAEIIDLRMLDRWSKNPDGAEWFVWLAARKSDPALTRETVRGWGSIMGRVNLASRIFSESITSGEESNNPKAEGEPGGASPPTGP